MWRQRARSTRWRGSPRQTTWLEHSHTHPCKPAIIFTGNFFYPTWNLEVQQLTFVTFSVVVSIKRQTSNSGAWNLRWNLEDTHIHSFKGFANGLSGNPVVGRLQVIPVTVRTMYFGWSDRLSPVHVFYGVVSSPIHCVTILCRSWHLYSLWSRLHFLF